jgi:hypothetical protein
MAYGSIVDYMNANKLNSSFANRSTLAKQYGISNYTGSAQQNTQLLGLLQKPKTVTPPKPVAAPAAPVPTTAKPVTTTPTYTNWMDAINHSPSQSGYNGALNGDNTRIDYNGHVIDTNNQDWINQALAGGAKIAKTNLAGYGGQNVDYHALSIAALSGDKQAQAFLNALGNKGQTGDALWNGITNDQLEGNYDLRQAYVAANPYADYTKQYDKKNYDTISGWIQNGQQVSDDQMEAYKKIAGKWNLQDASDPFVQQQLQLQKDKQDALNAQDVALNQGMATMDANSFQQFQQLQQQMAERGMGDSGIAADAYMRSQMANNQNYQQAFAQATQAKSDTATKYDQDIAASKQGQLKNQQDQAAQAHL